MSTSKPPAAIPKRRGCWTARCRRTVENSCRRWRALRGQMKTNLMGMSFLDRLESWGVRADRLMLHGYPDVTGSINAPRRHRRDRAGIE